MKATPARSHTISYIDMLQKSWADFLGCSRRGGGESQRSDTRARGRTLALARAAAPLFASLPYRAGAVSGVAGQPQMLLPRSGGIRSAL